MDTMKALLAALGESLERGQLEWVDGVQVRVPPYDLYPMVKFLFAGQIQAAEVVPGIYQAIEVPRPLGMQMFVPKKEDR